MINVISTCAFGIGCYGINTAYTMNCELGAKKNAMEASLNQSDSKFYSTKIEGGILSVNRKTVTYAYNSEHKIDTIDKWVRIHESLILPTEYGNKASKLICDPRIKSHTMSCNDASSMIHNCKKIYNVTLNIPSSNNVHVAKFYPISENNDVYVYASPDTHVQQIIGYRSHVVVEERYRKENDEIKTYLFPSLILCVGGVAAVLFNKY